MGKDQNEGDHSSRMKSARHESPTYPPQCQKTRASKGKRRGIIPAGWKAWRTSHPLTAALPEDSRQL